MRRAILALVLTLVWTSSALAQVSVVGSEGKDCGWVASCSPDAGVVTQSGDLLIVMVALRNLPTNVTVSDATNGSWTCNAALTHTATSRLASICYFENSGAATITPTVVPAEEDQIQLGFLVLRGMSPDGGIDDYATNTNDAVTTHSHGEITAASTAGAIFAVLTSTSMPDGWTGASGFTTLHNHPRGFMQYRVSGAASLTTTASVTSGSAATTGGVIASFFAAPASGGPRRGLLLGVGQ